VSLPSLRRGTELRVDATCLAAIKIKLTDEEIQQLEEPYQPQPIIGHV